MHKYGLAALAAAALVAMPLTSVSAKTLSVASGAASGADTTLALDDFVAYLTKETDLKAKVFPQSLLSFQEMSSGLRDGIADAGSLLTVYFPAEYAETNLAANLSMLSTSGKHTDAPGMAMAAAITEYVMLHCPGCQEEFKRQNQVFLGGAGTSAYIMLCNGAPIRSLEDIKGKKLRTGAANYGRWAEAVNAVKVSLPGNEMYEGMSQGAIDCTLVSAPELINFQLIDVTKSITTGVPGGVFSGHGTNMNLDTWNSLSDKERTAVLRAGSIGTASVATRYYDTSSVAFEKAREKGIEIVPAGDDLVTATTNFIDNDVKQVAEEFETKYSLTETAAKVETVRGLVDKWKDLIEPVIGDKDAFAQLLWDEIYSKVNSASYGESE